MKSISVFELFETISTPLYDCYCFVVTF